MNYTNYNEIDFSKLKQDGFTKADIQKYWEDGNYLNIKNLDINKLCFMWAAEEGIELPKDFSVTKFNSQFFAKTNSNKSVTQQILSSLLYDTIPTEELTFDKDYAKKRGKELLRLHGGEGFIRGNRFAGGGASIHVKSEEDVDAAIEKLHTLRKQPILPLFSPFFKAEVEHGVFMVGNEVIGVVEKMKNPENGLHNLTLGAQAYLLKDEEKLNELKEFCKDIPLHFNTGFIRIDVMDTTEGLKIVELSIPNFKKFSILNPTNYLHGKMMFIAYYNKYYRG